MGDGALLEARGLEAAYGGSRILRGVDFRLEAGSVTALLGRNGVGKSTLLKALMGLLPARAGTVRFRGRELGGLAADGRARLGLAYVPQGRDIFPKLTVRENLELGLAARPDRPKRFPEEEVYPLFPWLAQMGKRLGGNLSGGQQQQLAIARALLGKPKALLLDEPTEGIQPSIILEIEAVIRRLREAGEVAIVLVEQYLDFARALGDRFYIMERGRMAMSGPIGELEGAEAMKLLAF